VQEVKIKQEGESFISGWKINLSVCDDVLAEIFRLFDKSSNYDKVRGYHRITSGAMGKNVKKKYLQQVDYCFSHYREKFNWVDHSGDWFRTEPFNLQRFDPLNAYSPRHLEDGGPVEGKLMRKLTWCTYLNTIKNGGETEWQYQKVSYQPVKGDTIIFPAYWTHPHWGLPAITETKYIATGWASYKHRA
tara:strand:- start:179 stop:745 length:567 start_codon:yes stop_codon:yes gene_type:complete